MTGDPHRLRQIANNLVGNAVKFTHRGEVVLQVRCTPSEDGDQHHLHLTVTDTGMGIPPEDQPRVFERFYQSRPAKGRHPGGTGLGLSITHSLVELMGGTIQLTSAVGRGTRMEVSLTLAADVTSRRPTRPHPPASRGTVMLVSAHVATAGMMRAHLEWAGFTVTLASAWPEDPLALANVRAILACVPPPKSVESSKDMAPWFAVGPSAQYAGCIPKPLRLIAKPLRPSRVVLALDELLDRPADVAIVSPDAAPLVRLVSETATATILLAEDNPDNQRFAVHVLATAGHIVHVAHDGQEAAERAAAYRYDVILMDLQMPIMDGNKATAAIRREEHQREESRVPIVALTAHAVEGFREQCLKIGADDYATKPLRRGRLLEIVSLWMDTRPAILVLRTAPQAVEAARQFVRTRGRCFRLHVAADVASFAREVERQRTGLALIDALSPDAPTLLRHVRTKARSAGTPVVGLLPDHIKPVLGALGTWARELDALIPLGQVQATLAALARDAKASPTTDGPADVREFDFAPELADLVGGYVEKRLAELDVLATLTAQGDFERVRWIGHDLKGSGGTYGMPEITRLGGVLAAAAAAKDRGAIEHAIVDLSALLDRARTHLHATPPRA
jgi:CheY-like chemotaxis protein